MRLVKFELVIVLFLRFSSDFAFDYTWFHVSVDCIC